MAGGVQPATNSAESGCLSFLDLAGKPAPPLAGLNRVPFEKFHRAGKYLMKPHPQIVLFSCPLHSELTNPQPINPERV